MQSVDLTMSVVSYKQGELPPLTEEQEARLKALPERPDEEIDYSDIPHQDERHPARSHASLHTLGAGGLATKTLFLNQVLKPF